jgi:hypothetical protein
MELTYTVLLQWKKAINTAYSTYYDKAIPLQYTVYNFFV